MLFVAESFAFQSQLPIENFKAVKEEIEKEVDSFISSLNVGLKFSISSACMS